jgi:hypothetical protein
MHCNFQSNHIQAVIKKILHFYLKLDNSFLITLEIKSVFSEKNQKEKAAIDCFFLVAFE